MPLLTYSSPCPRGELFGLVSDNEASVPRDMLSAEGDSEPGRRSRRNRPSILQSGRASEEVG
jgi:hypothetical protein